MTEQARNLSTSRPDYAERIIERVEQMRNPAIPNTEQHPKDRILEKFLMGRCFIDLMEDIMDFTITYQEKFGYDETQKFLNQYEEDYQNNVRPLYDQEVMSLSPKAKAQVAYGEHLTKYKWMLQEQISDKDVDPRMKTIHKGILISEDVTEDYKNMFIRTTLIYSSTCERYVREILDLNAKYQDLVGAQQARHLLDKLWQDYETHLSANSAHSKHYEQIMFNKYLEKYKIVLKREHKKTQNQQKSLVSSKS